MSRSYVAIGDAVSDSAVGAGTITGITDAGFPQVNHVAVAWLECEDGTVFDPHSVREKHIVERAAAHKGSTQ